MTEMPTLGHTEALVAILEALDTLWQEAQARDQGWIVEALQPIHDLLRESDGD